MKIFLATIFISVLLILGIFAFAQEISALTCPGVQTCKTSVSIPGACAGSTNQKNCISSGGTCSGSTCNFTSCSTSGSWTCSDTTAGSCTYSSGTCDESGDITTQYYSCGSSVGSCPTSSSTDYGACTRNTNGQSCGTNQVCSGGSCVTSCVSNEGQSCTKSNACDINYGTYNCDGSCNASNPDPLPANYDNLCTNACGTVGSINCSGSCSASAPSTCTNNIGETGYQCSSGCTAVNKTLSVSVTANPSSGKAPLKNVQIDASVGGTATGTITYKLDCTNDLVYDATETSSSTSYTFTKKCDYDAAGTYTVRVNVTRQTLGTSNTTGITVTPACDSISFTACSNAKDFGSGGSIGAMCGASQYYQAVVPAGKTCDVLFSVTPDSGADYDLYVENTAAACPSTTAWDCTSTNGAGINDQCTTNLGPGTYKALVQKYGETTGSYAIASSVYNCKTISLSFPSTTWQRLWYNDPRVNNFSDSSFLGETPNESSLRFDTSWTNKQLYNTTASGTDNGKDKIGFKSGRSITVNQSGTYQFIIGSDDGASLYVDNSLIIDQWSIGSWRTKTGTVFLAAGTHNLEFRYFENTGDARAFFSPSLSIAVEPASIVQGTQLTLTAYCAGSVCEGKTVFWDHSSSGSKPGTCVLSGGTCQTTFTTAGIGTGTVNFWATSDISNDGDTTDDGEKSANVPVTISACAKNYDLIQDSTKVTVPTAGGTKECTVNINSSGQDLSDSSNVKYYSTLNSSTTGSTRTVEMDDEPIGAGDCDLDLKWTTFFDDPLQGKLDVVSRALEKNALQGTWPFQTARDLSFQYNLSSSSCVFTGFSPGTANDDDGSSGENAWTNPTISTNKRAVVKKHGVKENFSSNETNKQVFSNRQFTLKECVSNDQCNPSSLNPNSDASSTKQICNIDANNNGVGDITSNFSPNTCIDSMPPDITAGIIKRTSDGTSLGTTGTGQWLRAAEYEIAVTVEDNTGGSGVDTGYRLVVIRSAGPDDEFETSDDRVTSLVRTSANTFTFLVGSSPNALNNCVDQTDGKCRVEIYAKDLAGNTKIIQKYLNIDFTPPTAQ